MRYIKICVAVLAWMGVLLAATYRSQSPVVLGRYSWSYACLIFPRFHGHRVKSPSPSFRTRRGSGSRGSNAGGLGYRILRSIRKCPAWLLRGSDSADDARVPFSAYGRSFLRRPCPSSTRADSCSPSGRDRRAIRGTWWRRTGTRRFRGRRQGHASLPTIPR